jgi:hypothetical protein
MRATGAGFRAGPARRSPAAGFMPVQFESAAACGGDLGTIRSTAPSHTAGGANRRATGMLDAINTKRRTLWLGHVRYML